MSFDTDQIARLPESDLRTLIASNVAFTDETVAVWENLTHPAVVHRTYGALTALVELAQYAVGCRRRTLEQNALEWAAQGDKGRRAYKTARNQFEHWRTKNGRYVHVLQRRVVLVRNALKDARVAAREAEHVAADAARADRRRHERHALRLLAQAVRRHRLSHDTAAETADDADRQLWDTLGQITVFHRDRDVPLEQMLNTAWAILDPTPQGRPEADALSPPARLH